MKQEYCCRKISPGIVEGEVLISSEPILFYHTDPKTGIVTEHGHCLKGISVKDKILVFPGGKGSSVVQTDGMYKLEKEHSAPIGLIVRELDTVLVTSAIIMELPMIYRVEEEFYRIIRNGMWIRIDTNTEKIELVNPKRIQEEPVCDSRRN